MKLIPRNTVKVNPPLNLTRNDKALYSGGEFDLYNEDVIRIANIKLTYSGLCFKGVRLVEGSTHLYHSKVPIFEKTGQLELDLLNTIDLDNSKQYLVVHHPWYINYFHWITEALPRIWTVRDELKTLILLLPENYRSLAFVTESIRAFDSLKIEYIPHGNNANVPNAVIPRHKPFSYCYQPKTVAQLADFFKGMAGMQEIPLGCEYLYVMRGDSSRRRIINEGEVIKMLDSYQIKSVDLRSQGFFTQVALAMNTKLLISNGSGLTNMIFMPANAFVMEFHKRLTNKNDFLDRVTWYLASVCNLKYAHQFCDPVQRKKDMYLADLKVNLEVLRKNIEICLHHVQK